MRTVLLGCAAAGALAHAAGSDDAILVLDASGSMWGEVEGRHKVLIARDVIGDLLVSLPDDQRLGLVAYGHNRRGDCSDIETVAPLGSDRETIRAAVNALSPLGMTPLSDSVRHAAEALAYTENPATVILVSDGEETCEVDPCALGAELEAAGVDFTAHVIGFDIATDEERRQLQCLADATGGEFILASNAAELAAALETTVVAAPSPEPVVESRIRFRATDLAGGPEIESGLTWSIDDTADAVLYRTDAAGSDGPVELALPPGLYHVTVTRPSDGATAFGELTARASSQTFTLALERPLNATVSGPETAIAGAMISVDWTGPAEAGDFISVARADQSAALYETSELIAGEGGGALELPAPIQAAEYEIRYVLRRPVRVLATAPLTVTPVEASVSGPATIEAGAAFEATWSGPAYPGDMVVVARPEASGAIARDRAPAEGDPVVTLRAPGEPGAYELRYVARQEQEILARVALEVTPAAIALEGPQTVEAGAAFEVVWTGPANPGDNITIARPDQSGALHLERVAAADGSPAQLRAPGEPGVYELRYVLASGRAVAARTPITVGEPEISLSAAPSVEAGSPLEVTWTGPANRGDNITIARPDQSGALHVSRAATTEGSPVDLVAPGAPGEYELRYVLASGRAVAESVPLTVTAPDIAFTAPAAAPAGSMVEIAWTGPNNPGDQITIARTDQSGALSLSRVAAAEGSPQWIEAPGTAGDYELRYVLRPGSTVTHRQPFTSSVVTPVFDGPSSAAAGASFAVSVTSPAYPRDQITLARPDQSPALSVARATVDGPGTVTLQAPDEPGEYELRYFIRATGGTILERRPFEVTPN